ncbi:MAG TPA: hypothetical protein DEQ80_06285 [Anaerolinea thermolimosa]|uniref:Protein containing PQQ-like domain n=1 Tax=Anaerolinea thermolimosa TaxID=229919 RepID=A0A0M9U2N6_9CHLR|nr:PQQ-binding-like beta-propeller repeat protein [Anaerolinea thermolimosa]GAP08775.1 protein containing PQQ-like domain [Anaerolinea thermolimosa]GAP08825.1 protein containing PQQ-like domain [Anaerolinea thermolimosa]HCE17449.1 hypothetical protein [Anaerolinea thermolimosa]
MTRWFSRGVILAVGVLWMAACTGGIPSQAPPQPGATAETVGGMESPTASLEPTLTATSGVSAGPSLTPEVTADARPALTPEALSGTPSCSPPERAEEDALQGWPQLGHDPRRTSFYPAEVTWPWKVRWIWNGPADSGDGEPAPDHLSLPQGVQPVSGDGRLYVGHTDGRVRAISEETGQTVWTSESLGGAIVNAGAYSASTGCVYFGAQNGKFTLLDARTGELKRMVDLHGAIDMAPLLAGDSVFVGSQSGVMYALDSSTLAQRWAYDAGAALIASPAFSENHGGMVLVLAEDRTVHALSADTGKRLWRVTVNADVDPIRKTVFADTFPVVSDRNDVVIVRSYLNWEKIWQPDGGAPSTVEGIREFLTQNPEYQSLFVLNLADGTPRFVAPVMLGAIGNGGDLESTPPQVVLRPLADGTEVAILLWRNRQSCPPSYCDSRSDTTLGEMDLTTGVIRFVQDHKDQGNMRLPTDEQSPLAMAGDMIFYAHWQLLGALKVIDRSAGLGESYANPIITRELTPVLNTLAPGVCAGRSAHFCPGGMSSPGEGFAVDPGFYIYVSEKRIYDQYWTTPVRSVVISGGNIYWKSVDGAVIALTPAGP